MATVVLFHSALGLRPAVLDFADAIRADGHTVHTPDLFDGQVFDRLEDGVALRDALGIPTLMSRAHQAISALPPDLVYMGFSMGASSAQWLGATRPGATAVVLMHAVLPLAALGVDAWPAVPVQVHYAEGDPWVDPAVAAAFDAEAGPSSERFIYPHGGHLFADPGTPDFHAESAQLMAERIGAFLGRVGEQAMDREAPPS